MLKFKEIANKGWKKLKHWSHYVRGLGNQPKRLNPKPQTLKFIAKTSKILLFTAKVDFEK